MRKVYGVAVIVTVLMVLMASGAGAEAYRHQKTGILFPDTINALKLVKVTDYEPLYAGLGTGISYRTETMRADIFLYDLTEGPIPEGASSSAAGKEFDQAIGDIMAMEQKGTYKNVSVVIRKETVPVGRVKFLHGVLTYEQNNIKLVSHLYLTGYRGLFMKLRITYFASAREAEGANYAAFLSTIDNLMRPSK
jgi:hypothetical protein